MSLEEEYPTAPLSAEPCLGGAVASGFGKYADIGEMLFSGGSMHLLSIRFAREMTIPFGLSTTEGPC